VQKLTNLYLLLFFCIFIQLVERILDIPATLAKGRATGEVLI
jgi:hypothetical protein